MLATARAHEQWAQCVEATSSEAATSTVFASQIRQWVETLESRPTVGAVDPHADSTGKLTTREKGI